MSGENSLGRKQPRHKSTTYKRDGAYVTDPVLSDSSAAFTPGISERRSGASKFYGSDYLGTNSLITNSSQATTDTKQYDAFGMLVSSTGSTPTPFGFAGGWGYQEDADSGLKLLGHRYYDATTGRFLTRDPKRDGRNWFTYAESCATKAVDPDGLVRVEPAFRKKYPRASGIIRRTRLTKGKHKAFRAALDTVDEEVLKLSFTNGRGPRVRSKDLGGAYGLFQPGQGSDIIFLDEDLLEDVEAGKKGAWKLLRITIEHEVAHFVDDRDWKDTPGEEGDAYERKRYGSVIYDYPAAEKVIPGK